jgi:hypothetical protein
LRLIVDEDLASRSFVRALRSRLGEDAVATFERGLSDAEIWETAQRHRRAIVTQNAKDFAPMAAGADHAGLLLVSRHADRAKDLTATEIVDRVARIASLHEDLTGFVLVVNGFDPLPG